jgi:hypothetical protein
VSAAARPGWLRDTGGLYVRVFKRAAALALRNWPVALVLFGFGMLRDVLDAFIGALGTGPLSLVGGFLSYLVFVAFMSSWLFLVAEVIRTGRIQPRDWLAGLGAYFGDLLTVLFLFWIIVFVAQILFLTAPLVGIVLALALLTFGNAVPELVYLGRHPPAAILVESYRFIGENWIEWFPANILLAGCVYGVSRLALELFPSLFVPELVTSLALYFAMIARGLLFQELATSSRRARAFRRAAE